MSVWTEDKQASVWLKVEGGGDTPAVIQKVSKAELATFQKQHHAILRGWKLLRQLDALVALRNNPGMFLVGWSDAPVLSGTPPLAAAADSCVKVDTLVPNASNEVTP